MPDKHKLGREVDHSNSAFHIPLKLVLDKLQVCMFVVTGSVKATDIFSTLTELNDTSDDGNLKVLGLKGNYRGQTFDLIW